MSPTKGPAVGAALPVYNGARYLEAALNSVLAQNYPVDDVVVVDDGSTDESRTIAMEFGPPVRVAGLGHQGVGAARSHAMSLVRGEWIVTLDADDLLTERSVESRIETVRVRPEVDIVYGRIRSFAEVEGGRPVPIGPSLPAHVPAAMLVRRAAYERVGPFSADLRVAEGLDWLLRAHELGIVEATLEDQVQWRRVHGENNSLTQRSSMREFPRALKESLDRRRAR